MAAGTLHLTPPVERALLKQYITGETLTAAETAALAPIGTRTLQVALYNSFDPFAETPTGVEITGTGYTAGGLAVTFVAAMGAPYTKVWNNGALQFGPNTGGAPWTAINYVLVRYTPMGTGILALAWLSIAPAVVIAVGQSAIIPLHGISITID